MPHMYVNIPVLWSIWGVGINDEPPGTSILFIGCFNWMMNHIFTTKQVVKLTKDPLMIWLNVRFPGFKFSFILFSTEKSRPIKDFPEIPHVFWRPAPWCSSLVLTWETATSKRRKDVPRTSKRDEIAASRWNVPSDVWGSQTVSPQNPWKLKVLAT